MTKCSFPFLTIINPFTFIVVTLWCFPLSMTIFQPIFPKSFKSLSIMPLKNAKVVPQSIFKLSRIKSLHISLDSFSLYIIRVLSFIYNLLSYFYSISMLLIIFIHKSEVNTIILFQNSEIMRSEHIFEDADMCFFCIHGFIVGNECLILRFIRYFEALVNVCRRGGP